MSEKTRKPVLILVGDSRVYGFEKFDYRNFYFRYVIQRGAVVNNLINDTLSIVSEYKDQDRPVIVKIYCGINEFTVFKQRERKEGKRSRETRAHRDLRFNDNVTSRQVFDKLKSLKRKIKTILSTAVVGFVTIPTLSVVKYRDSKSDKEQRSLLPTDEQLEIDQTKLDNKLNLLNTGLEPAIKLNLMRIPMHRKQEVKELLNDMLEREVIRPSNSPWSSPIVLVKKKDNTTRFCVDFRKVNEITKTRTQYPALMTRLIRYMVPDIFPVLIWPAAIGKLNCKKKKRKKTSFSMSYGLYEFNVMPFGHTGAPGLFKRLMENVLKGLQFEICLIYLDDVVIFSSSFNEHLQRLRLVFDRFRESGLKLKLTKCHFAGRSVKCLGHIVSDKGIMTDPDKIEVIRTWPQPTNARDVKSFLGLASYYRRFIKGFSTICSPLNKFLQKEESFSWSSKCDEAFQMLKSKLVTAPILSYPTEDGIFTLDTDASSTSIGAVLSRQGDSEKVICYASRMLTKSERN
jgi:hypothetical protein